MKRFKSWKFGDTKKQADELVNLIILGKKRATSSLYDSYKRKKQNLPKIGDKTIIKDSRNKNKCLIVITSVKVKPFKKVSAAFARKEGEGNCSLAHWRRVHKKFFIKRLIKRKGKFNENILVVCEEFRVLKVFD